MNNKHLEPLGGGINIYVSDSYRFSTDTILLADFSKQIGAKKCVDLGTGCGTIPLLWYKNNNRLDITAVEIQENACKLFSQSLEYNNLQDKIRIVNSDLNKLDGALPL
ncbi:MAG: methyltransferase, partial [Ruminococcus bromii]